jgi:hypothetical protein
MAKQQFRELARRAIRQPAPQCYRLCLERLEDRSVPCTVANLNDADPPSVGMLRYCMLQQPSVIDFDENLAGTLQLIKALPIISWSANLDGQPLSQNEQPDITIRGEGEADPYRIFEIAAGATVTIKDLRIANGLASEGGGIKNLGTLALYNTVVENNFAAQLTDEFEIHGAGISNHGTLTITDASRVQGNRMTTILPNCVIVMPEGGGVDNPFGLCPHRFFGAGIYNDQGADLEINDGSIIEGNFICEGVEDFCHANSYYPNSAEFHGGGIESRQKTVDGKQ